MILTVERYWFKTTNNCYVSQQGLYEKPDRDSLDYCGPIPLLEIANHNNENGTSEVNKREPEPEASELIERDPAPAPVEEAPRKSFLSSLLARAEKYLIQVTVGEEYAYCRECPKDSCKSQKRYEYNQSVVLQCLVRPENDTYWSQTTDFCYMKSSDFWESPEGDSKLFGHGKIGRKADLEQTIGIRYATTLRTMEQISPRMMIRWDWRS